MPNKKAKNANKGEVPYFYTDGSSKMTLDEDLATQERRNRRAARFAGGESQRPKKHHLNLTASLNNQLLGDFEESNLSWEVSALNAIGA